jgi:hypothetical protein
LSDGLQHLYARRAVCSLLICCQILLIIDIPEALVRPCQRYTLDAARRQFKGACEALLLFAVSSASFRSFDVQLLSARIPGRAARVEFAAAHECASAALLAGSQPGCAEATFPSAQLGLDRGLPAHPFWSGTQGR